MADNFTTNAGVGGDTFAADDISGVKFPRTKLTIGADGANDGDVSKANGLPVSGNTAANGSGTETRILVDAAGNPQVDIVGSLPAGTNNIGDVDVASIAAGTNKIGAVNLEAHTSGGWTPHSHISTGTGDEDATSVKASAGQLGFVFVTNVDDAVAFLKFYNKASAPDENDTPILRLAIPGAAAGAGLTFNVPPGLVFSTGIAYRLTTAYADNSTAPVTAGEVLVNLGYK